METIETITIEVVVNGVARTIPVGISLDRLLEWLKIDASRVAVELNGQPGGWRQLWFVGGGAN